MPASGWTFAFEVVNFALLVVGLAWVFTRPMKKLLDDELAQRVREDAEREKVATELKSEREALEAARSREADEIARRRDEARAAAEAEAARIVADAREAAAALRERAQREAAARKRGDVEALGRAVGETVEKLVLEVFSAGAGPESDVAFARGARSELARLAATRRGRVVIECAHPLDELARSALRESLGPAFDDAEVRVVPELVAGVRVETDAGLVDASARGLAQHAERAMGGEAHG